MGECRSAPLGARHSAARRPSSGPLVLPFDRTSLRCAFPATRPTSARPYRPPATACQQGHDTIQCVPCPAPLPCPRQFSLPVHGLHYGLRGLHRAAPPITRGVCVQLPQRSAGAAHSGVIREVPRSADTAAGRASREETRRRRPQRSWRGQRRKSGHEGSAHYRVSGGSHSPGPSGVRTQSSARAST